MDGNVCWTVVSSLTLSVEKATSFVLGIPSLLHRKHFTFLHKNQGAKGTTSEPKPRGKVAFMTVMFVCHLAANICASKTFNRPPMGWNAWFAFDRDVTEVGIRANAEALVRTGLKDAGYMYVERAHNRVHNI